MERALAGARWACVTGPHRLGAGPSRCAPRLVDSEQRRRPPPAALAPWAWAWARGVGIPDPVQISVVRNKSVSA